ncbi:MlaD family protein [Patulibacter defluvii]|uniref:MlaD family protein n=1 Tax=Patulibacter defluvii TaxID=3095358 RepID=UPI002A76495D|nr:MlaD family protein [Patulibacter sp. DM4]
MRIEHRSLKILAIVTFTAICVGIFAWLFGKAGGTLPGAESKYEAKVLVPTAFQLVPNGDVRRAGVKVGKVTDISSRGDVGVVTIAIDKDQGPVYRDATVKVRTKTLVGENYIDLDPGTPQAGPLKGDAALPLEQAGEAVQLDQILSGLDKPTRAAVQRNLDALGPGFRGRGDDLNEFLGAATPTIRKVGDLTELLDGQRDQLARVVDDTGTVMQAFGDRTADVRKLAIQAKNTAEAAASRDQRISDVLDRLPGTLQQVKSTVAHLGRVSRSSTPVVADLKVAAQNLPPVTERLAAAAKAGQQLFDVLPGFSKQAEPMLRSLRVFGDETTPVVPALDAVLRNLNPALAYLGPRATDMATAFANMGSAVDTRDATGNLARVHLTVDEHTLTGMRKEVTDTLNTLISVGGLAGTQGLRFNAYPDPGQRGNPQLPKGDPPRLAEAPSALRDSGR